MKMQCIVCLTEKDILSGHICKECSAKGFRFSHTSKTFRKVYAKKYELINYKKIYTMICPICGSTFKTDKGMQKYDSMKCALIAKNQSKYSTKYRRTHLDEYNKYHKDYAQCQRKDDYLFKKKEQFRKMGVVCNFYPTSAPINFEYGISFFKQLKDVN